VNTAMDLLTTVSTVPGIAAMSGVVALIVAAKNNIFSVAQRARLLAVKTAEFVGHRAVTPLIGTIRADWKIYTIAPDVFLGYVNKVKDRPQVTPVYHMVPTPCVIRKGWRFALLTARNESELTLTYIRGTINIEELVCSSYEYSEQRVAQRRSSFRVISFYGSSRAHTNKQNKGADDDDAPVRGDTAETVPSNSGSGRNLPYDIQYEKLIGLQPSDIINTHDDPRAGLFYDPEVDDLIDRINRWYGRREWYAERNIPWKRGILLYGPPGTGKSMLAKVVAQSLGLPLYEFHLGSMTDSEFLIFWNHKMDSPGVVLFEDIDGVFHGRDPANDSVKLTFDTLLTSLSGVNSPEGMIVFVTTNNIHHVDEALGVDMSNLSRSTRPGRIDELKYMGYASENVKRQLASKVLRDWPDLIEQAMVGTDNMTVNQMENHCVVLAEQKLHEEELSRLP